MRVERADGCVLAVTVMGERDRWLILAIETPATLGEDAALANHAHTVIGRRRNLRKALSLAETWAQSWKGRSDVADPCMCHEAGLARLVPA